MSSDTGMRGGIPVADVPPPRHESPQLRWFIAGCVSIVLIPPIILGAVVAWYFWYPRPTTLPGNKSTVEAAWVKPVTLTSGTDPYFHEFRATRDGMAYLLVWTQHEWADGGAGNVYFLALFDENGERMWERPICAVDPWAGSVTLAPAPDGSCYVMILPENAGHVFEDRAKPFEISPADPNPGVLVRISADGEWAWHARFHPGAGATITGLGATEDNACILVLCASGGAVFASAQQAESNARTVEISRNQATAVKYTSQGDIDWIHQIPVSGEPGGVEVFPDGGMRIHSVSRNLLSVVTADRDGQVVWNRKVLQLGAPISSLCWDHNEAGESVFATPIDRDVIVMPSSDAETSVAPSESGEWDFIVVKIDGNGNLVWRTQFGPVDNYSFERNAPAFLPDMCLFPDGSCLMSGYFSGAVVFGASHAVNGKLAQRAARTGYLNIHIDPNGQIVSASNIARMPGGGRVYIHDIGDGHDVAISGDYRGSIVFGDKETAPETKLESDGFGMYLGKFLIKTP